MTDYKLDLNFAYETCMNFKEKEINVLKNIISFARLGREMTYRCGATITFDETDKTHLHPNVHELEKYARSKTNGIVYNVLKSNKNPGIYDRCLIYHTEPHQVGSWGFVMFNSETGKSIHMYMVGDDYSDLIQKLSRVINYANIRFNYSNPADVPIKSHYEKIIETA